MARWDEQTNRMAKTDLNYKREVELVRTDIIRTDSALHPLCGLVVVKVNEDVTGSSGYWSFRNTLDTFTLAYRPGAWDLVKATEKVIASKEEVLDQSSVPKLAREDSENTFSPFVRDAVATANRKS